MNMIMGQGKGKGGRDSVRLGRRGWVNMSAPSSAGNEDMSVLERAVLVRGEDQCGRQGEHG